MTGAGKQAWEGVMEICAASCVGIASVAAVPQPVLKAITASTDVFVCSGLVLVAQH